MELPADFLSLGRGSVNETLENWGVTINDLKVWTVSGAYLRSMGTLFTTQCIPPRMTVEIHTWKHLTLW